MCWSPTLPAEEAAGTSASTDAPTFNASNGWPLKRPQPQPKMVFLNTTTFMKRNLLLMHCRSWSPLLLALCASSAACAIMQESIHAA